MLLYFPSAFALRNISYLSTPLRSFHDNLILLLFMHFAFIPLTVFCVFDMTTGTSVGILDGITVGVTVDVIVGVTVGTAVTVGVVVTVGVAVDISVGDGVGTGSY